MPCAIFGVSNKACSKWQYFSKCTFFYGQICYGSNFVI